MKIAILAEDKAGFIKPMAEGLAKMLKNSDVEATIFYQGLAHADLAVSQRLATHIKSSIKTVVNLFSAIEHYIPPKVTHQSYREFIASLKSFDAVVVVCPLPRAFAKGSLSAIDDIRDKVQVPVVLYQNYFLASRGSWYEKIASAGGQGLERFDWYLAATTVSEYPLVELDDGRQWPVTSIGHDLHDESLACQFEDKAKAPFRVLLDFPRQGFESYRNIQKQVLDKMGLPYTELSGRYSIVEIRKLYREHHVFMLSFRESFGLPIVENQLCGNWIFTPYKDWCPGHYLHSEDADESAEKLMLGDNFVVYDDAHQLELRLSHLVTMHLQGYDYQENFNHFAKQYPSFNHGNKQTLVDFIARFQSGEINRQSHLDFSSLNKFIANC